MSSLIPFFEQVAKSATILLDDVVVLAKPALSRIGDTALAAKMAAASAADDTLPLAKTAMKKATAVVVDDTAVSSDQLSEGGIAQHREYAVWRKIVAGSLMNKVLILVVIMVTGAVAPVVPHVMLAFGAAYLAFEGAHKAMEYAHSLRSFARRWRGLAPVHQGHGAAEHEAAATIQRQLPAFIDRFLGSDPKERSVLVDLILLDAILSTEILLVANGTLGEVGLAMQAFALGIVGAGTTLGVYGIVLLIIRVDNVAGYFANPENRFYLPALSKGMMQSLPYLLKVIGVVGTVAMLGVAGEVALHMLPSTAEALGAKDAAQSMHHVIQAFPDVLSFLPFGAETAVFMSTGLVIGLVLISLAGMSKRLARKRPCK
jgi:predicted DNA repair protein MutK